MITSSRVITVVLAACWATARTLGAPGDLDNSFSPASGVNGRVNTVAVQPDGKVFIGGNFTTVRGAFRSGIARLNGDGTVDRRFDPGLGVGHVDFSGPSRTNLARTTNYGGGIYTLVLQPDGKVLIQGNFVIVNGTYRNGIARLSGDGTLDSSFNPEVETDEHVLVSAMALQPDGKVLVGKLTNISHITSGEIVRLDEGGAVDRSFNAGTMAIHGFRCRSVSSIALQADGKAVVAGRFISTNYDSRDYVVRLHHNGSLDEAFTPANASATAPGGYGSSISCIKIQDDGAVLVAGSFGVINGTVRNRIARLNADGSLDASFDPGTGAQVDGIVLPAIVQSVGLQTDGRLVVGGNFTLFAGTNRKHIARLNLNGSLDTTFDPGSGASSFVWCVALQGDGKVLAGGEFTMMSGTNRSRLARLHADGRLDDAFEPGRESAAPAPDVSVTAVRADGKVLLAGASFTVDSFDPPLVDRIACLNSDGSLDTNFTRTTANGNVFAMVLEADGKVLVGGSFTAVNATNRKCVARLNADGTLDGTFDPGAGPNSVVYAAAAQPDGKVLVGGIFTAVNGTNRSRIAGLNPDGSLDTAFDPGTGANSDVRAIVVQRDGKVLLGGSFTNVNGYTRRGLARLEPDGSVDQTFDPAAGGRAVALQSDGKVLVGGLSGVSRLQADGSLDHTFSPARVDSGMFVRGIYSIAMQPDGKIVVVGSFSSINGIGRNRIARLNADGTLDMTFNPAAPNGEVYAVAVQADGRVLIGGGFTRIGTVSRNRIARLEGDGAVLIHGPAKQDGDFVARFRGMPGWSYTLEYAESIGGTWRKLMNWTAPTNDIGWGVGGFELREAIGDSQQRFYRMADPAY